MLWLLDLAAAVQSVVREEYESSRVGALARGRFLASRSGHALTCPVFCYFNRRPCVCLMPLIGRGVVVCAALFFLLSQYSGRGQSVITFCIQCWLLSHDISSQSCCLVCSLLDSSLLLDCVPRTPRVVRYVLS